MTDWGNMVGMSMMDVDELVERLAELEHDQWMQWSSSIASKEKLSDERVERWEKLWVSYDELSEDDKESDREWARRVLEVLDDATVLRLAYDVFARYAMKWQVDTDMPDYHRITLKSLHVAIDNTEKEK